MARPRFEATAERRRTVEKAAGFGLTHEQIALLIGCNQDTLRRHFAHELATGAAKSTFAVARSLYTLATSGNVAASIFWMKARAKWRDRPDEDDGGTVTVNVRGGLPDA